VAKTKKKDLRRADALRAAEARVKECQQRYELARLGGNQSEIESKLHKLKIAMAQEAQLRHKVKRKHHR